MRDGCPFCDYAGPSPVLESYFDDTVIVFEPLNPVVAGHVVVVPRRHAADFAVAPPFLVADVLAAAAHYARRLGDCNLITSRGAAATQTVFHLHVHLVPRREGDGLLLPWSVAASV